MKKYVIIILSMMLITGSCNQPKQEKTETLKTEFLEKVTTVKAVLSYQEKDFLLTGKVEYDPDRIIGYTPLISGIVEKTYFATGDKVQKGQPLLDLRSAELSALQAEKISLEAEEKVAERELKTAQSMFDDGMLSERELLEAKGRLQQIQAAKNKIKSDMSVYGEDKGNGIFSVHAPMSGFIVHKKASVGSPVSADNEPVFTIADLSTVWIMANVYAGDLPFVREGMDVEITSLSYPDEVFRGKINALSQVFDPEEKVLKARIVMDNKDLKLKPEMSVRVILKNETKVRYVSVPSDALIFDDNRYFVVVKDVSNDFKIKEVTLHDHHKKTTYITSGLSEGESVVVTNQLLIFSELK